jgi:translation elongation factor EF-1alpha
MHQRQASADTPRTDFHLRLDETDEHRKRIATHDVCLSSMHSDNAMTAVLKC